MCSTQSRPATICTLIGVLAVILAVASSAAADDSVDRRISAVSDKVVGWRRHIHQNPELSNREFETAALVAAHLNSLDMEVRTRIGVTGVVGILHGRGPGPVLALRADMDALPVKEATGLPFASRVFASFGGVEVPVMHACGHDAHTAMLMGAAEVLSGLKDQFDGTVMFVFQGAEEGPPPGEEGGAQLMLREGVFDDPTPDAILGLHVEPGPLGQVQTRAHGFLPSASSMQIYLSGRQTHAARPWEGTDLINLTADIVKSITTLSARQFDVFDVPNVVTVATIQAGNRDNILPGEARLAGTVRTYSNTRKDRLKSAINSIVSSHAKLYGAEARVDFEDVAAVTYNDPELLARLRPALIAAAGEAGLDDNSPLRGAAEDFSFFQQQIPGLYVILGSTRDYANVDTPAPNHSPEFDIDEAVMDTGVRVHVLSALEFLRAAP